MAALYHGRWEVEGALAELKTHLRDARVALRGKTASWRGRSSGGLLLAHFAVRGLMHEAALRADGDPDRLSFLHAVRVVRRKLPPFAALPPPARAALHEAVLAEAPQEHVAGGRGRRGARRGVRARRSGYRLRPARPAADRPDRLRRRHQDRKVNRIGASPIAFSSTPPVRCGTRRTIGA